MRASWSLTPPTNVTGLHPRVVVGLTGGIAAYKVVSVIRSLVERGCDVHVIPTESALNFVGRATLEAVSRNPVHDSVFDGVSEVRHVAMGQSADAILIAPATANSLSAIAEGRADSLLLTSVLASTAPIVVAPAMHTEMWEQESTQANVATLVSRGVHLVGPASGRLTGNDSGVGRLAEPDDIVEAVLAVLAPKDFVGVRVLITAGGTREPIDPVRFIGNRSTGAMGVALAEAARDRGADVTLIAAHLEVPTPRGMRVIDVGTAAELRDAVLREFVSTDVFISSAAVSDYRVASPSPVKLKKSSGVPTLELVENPDVLAEAAAGKGDRVVVGFAAETDSGNFEAELARKAVAKGVDLLVGNLVGESQGFGNVPTDIVLVNSEGVRVDEVSGSKAHVAGRILDRVSRQKDSAR